VLIGRGPAAAKGGFVHHIVVEQRSGMNELHHSSQAVFVVFLVIQSTAREQQNNGAQALATR